MTAQYPPKPAPWRAVTISRCWLEPVDVARRRSSWIQGDRLAMVVRCDDKRERRVVATESLDRLWLYCEKRHCARAFSPALQKMVRRLFEEKRTEALFA